MRSRTRFWSFLLMLAVSSCSLPAPYLTYSPGTAPAPVRRAQVGLTVYGPNNTMPDNLYDPDMQDSAPTPDSTFTPAPSTPAQTPSQRIAICYNRLWNSADAVRTAATQACGGKSTARVDNQGIDLDACPLMTPTQAVFTCGGGP
jgi:hypothetical protein